MGASPNVTTGIDMAVQFSAPAIAGMAAGGRVAASKTLPELKISASKYPEWRKTFSTRKKPDIHRC